MEKRLFMALKGGEFENLTVSTSRKMAQVKSRGNKTTELRLRLALVRAGVRGWSLHRREVIGTPDFFFSTKHLAVFVDGCFWHGCTRCGHIPYNNKEFWRRKIDLNKSRDKKTSIQLRLLGVRVIRFWEHELSNELDKCVARIQAYL